MAERFGFLVYYRMANQAIFCILDAVVGAVLLAEHPVPHGELNPTSAICLVVIKNDTEEESKW
jgi:hypothetical protein